ELNSYLLGFQALPSIREALRGSLEMRDKLRELERRVSRPEERITKDKEVKDKYRLKIRWKPLTSDEGRRLEEWPKTAKSLASKIKKT
ncbi:MAG: hypothetical protein DRO14_05890, partial [Thermoprotei archaeon]